MNEKEKSVKISVRTLVEFLLRNGDITSGGMGVGNLEAMQEGSRIHRKIQKSMGVGYEAEVSLLTTVNITSDETGEDFSLVVEGRADGIYEDDGLVVIDEIKGVYASLSDMKEPDIIHMAQAKCYAYMVACDSTSCSRNDNDGTRSELDRIAVQITYCNMETEKIKRFREVYEADEIRAWFDDLIKMYRPWAVYEFDHAIIRNNSIQKLEFPYPYREGQDNLVAFAYTQIDEGKRLFIEAPTGVGKTISTVFPAVKSMGEGKTERIFYLTAKTITRTVAQDCFSLLTSKGLSFKPITITAKEKVCVLDRPDCDPARCERAKGHFDRVNEALYDILINEDNITRETINEYADKHMVCPFELCLDATLFSDAIICDYNYVFDPNVYLRRFFAMQKKTDTVLLIDEAHNLVERGRKMYSESIVKEDFLKMARILKAMVKKERRHDVAYNLRQLISALESVNRALLEFKRQCDSFMEIEDLGTIGFKLLRVISCYEVMIQDDPVIEDRDFFLDFYFRVRNFVAIWEVYDDHYKIYANYDDDGNFLVHLECMDPSHRLREMLDKVRASIFFSATLLPIKYYKEQLGGDDDDAAVYAKSSFSDEQRRILIARDVTTLYRSRGPAMYQRIAEYIEKFVMARKGNYLIFFPSYRVLEEVVDRVSLPGDIEVIMQGRRMSESEREEFLSRFDTDGDNEDIDVDEKNDLPKGLVGMCVMGGIFAEGIDLTGDRLIGACIVGTGLPMVCDERELYKRYFDERGNRGFDYAYLYPGIGKVFQAGGRVIRTAEDRGVVLLLDDRFLKNEYIRNFPREWQQYKPVTLDTLEDELESFYNSSSFLLMN